MTKKQRRTRQIILRIAILFLVVVGIIWGVNGVLALSEAKKAEEDAAILAKAKANIAEEIAVSQKKVKKETSKVPKANKKKATKKKEPKTEAEPETEAEIVEVVYYEDNYYEESYDAGYQEETEETYEVPAQETYQPAAYNGEVLNAWVGMIQGPSGAETYYNLPMEGVIAIMREAGFSEEEYPYWVRGDGVKMLGDYVMVAADFSIRPLGSLVECSLGTGIVCDTGTFIYTDPYQLDIAVNW